MNVLIALGIIIAILFVFALIVLLIFWLNKLHTKLVKKNKVVAVLFTISIILASIGIVFVLIAKIKLL